MNGKIGRDAMGVNTNNQDSSTQWIGPNKSHSVTVEILSIYFKYNPKQYLNHNDQRSLLIFMIKCTKTLAYFHLFLAFSQNNSWGLVRRHHLAIQRFASSQWDAPFIL